MKILVVFTVILLMGSGGLSQAGWTYLGDMDGPYKVQGNIVTFKCTNAVVTLEVCAEDILRIRASKSAKFKANEPWVVIKYDWPKSNFRVKDRGDYIDISTQAITVKAYKSPFRIDIYDEDTRALCLEPADGGMGFDGDKVICRKKLTQTNHFFGLGQRYEKSDLRGQKRELWVTENVTWIPFFMATDGYGIFFHNTWRTTFDFTKDPYYFSAPGGGELDYYFIYGPSFKQILNEYTKITGKSPLPPKWAFGLHASKWTRQQGQQGLLHDVTAARNEKNWPLDAVRVHAKNCQQGIWAGPALSWPDDGWGSFSAVDEMVKKLHAMNCHTIFWENPGIPANCFEKYEDAQSKSYFIMEGDSVWNGRFGYGMEPGGLVDFCNPAARKWWADLHNFLIDIDSDGMAGDHGEEVFGQMYSAYAKMSGEELHNLYSMLYDMSTWQAYKARNPNKRCVVWGRSLWAGTQRYPMQGTQDSHSEGKNIEGEIMGCINFGLSGVPFRIYTDNVTREILDSKKKTWPFCRLSQYLSLTVAGERTELWWTDSNQAADDNYRFYGRLRYRLMPYIYSYAHVTTQTGLPLVRAMVLEYQDDVKTYSAYGQYLLGKELLIAPLWSDTTFSREIYLPKGEWIDFWDGTMYEGGRTIVYNAPIDKAPILVKAGAIIPMAPDGQRYVDEKKGPLTVRVYPKGFSYFRLYEDDGISYDYQKVHALTTFKCIENGKGVIISKSMPKGSYKIPERDHIFRVHRQMAVKSVTLDNRPMAKLADKKNLDSASQGWFNDSDKGIIQVKVTGGVDKKLSVGIWK